MGSSAKARCSGCGYETFLMLGGGFSNHRTYAAWPVNCDDCAATTTANFQQAPLVCGKCGGANVVPITDSRNWAGDGKEIERWWDLRRTDGHHRCPRCHAFELKFSPGMMLWD